MACLCKTRDWVILTRMETKTGVILVNTGSPNAPTEEAVKAYLARFLMDPRLVSMPRPIWRYILHRHILPKRAAASAAKYKLIWTDEGTPQGSPLVWAHAKTAEGLATLLAPAGVPVLGAMCYTSPTVEDSLRKLRDAGCERIVYLPLYPQSAYTQVGSCTDVLGKACKAIGWHPQVELVHDYWDHDAYLQAIVDSIQQAGFDPARDYLDLSYHSVPLRDIRNNDTYEECVYKTNEILAQRLGAQENRWATGFQSVFGHRPQDWLAPLSTELMADWGRAGVRSVYYCCPGFAADCLETLYDIPHDMETAYRAAYHQAHPDAPDPSFTYVPCLDPVTVYPRILFEVLRDRSEFLEGLL